jgi:hypothetical protein
MGMFVEYLFIGLALLFFWFDGRRSGIELTIKYFKDRGLID